MKNLIVLVVVVALALLAYNFFTTGEISLMPGTSKSPEEQELNRLRGAFRAAAQEYRQAGRGAGLAGLDTTSAAGAALAAVDGVERDLKALRKRVEDPSLQSEVDELLREVQKYKKTVS